ncbi:hypothetical protein [Maribacter sp. 2210JD10-5]|uniref:hypothetical protein n=1 Tax=Maribacter sp. 2210JD10-5 TaxID=3386272 RepID=UPI0039BC9D52
MKNQNPFILFLFFAIAIYFLKKNSDIASNQLHPNKNYLLVVERGAFHNDCFELTPETITFYPNVNSEYSIAKYNQFSRKQLKPENMLSFFDKMESLGFWELNDDYKNESSCTSQLKVTLFVDGKSKTIRCDDFERDCPDIIQQIEKKVIEIEGNNLERIYLPG